MGVGVAAGAVVVVVVGLLFVGCVLFVCCLFVVCLLFACCLFGVVCHFSFGGSFCLLWHSGDLLLAEFVCWM